MIEIVVMMGLILVLTTGYTTLNIRSMQVQRANMMRDVAVHATRGVAEKAAALPWNVLTSCAEHASPAVYNGYAAVRYSDGTCPPGAPQFDSSSSVEGLDMEHNVYVLWPVGVSGATSPTSAGMKRIVVVTTYQQPTPGLPTKTVSTTIVRNSDPGEANLSSTAKVP